MRTEEQNIQLAEMLFPKTKKTAKDVFNSFPKRKLKEGEMVLRFAPSPTGFIHIGNIYTGMICVKFAKQSNGVSILRIEDTDKEREIENGMTMIVEGLKGFGVEFDEGMISEDKWHGVYGPYIQSKRLDIYEVFAKELVSKGLAYPCFLTEEELEDMRKKQSELNVRTGCYGKWSIWRDADINDIQERINKGEIFAIRLYSRGNYDNTFELEDLTKGRVTIRENDMDAILLKSDHFPTYHFAHPIDDTLMGITHVLRGDEWFSSVALHIEIFNALGFTYLPYAHLSPLMKMDDGKKRKLSKRKDPEFAVSYYLKKGYPKEGLLEYLLNIANSNFYDWRKQNPNNSLEEFQLRFEKFNKAGAIFDIVKLNDVCKEYLATLKAEEVYQMALDWSKEFDEKIFNLLSKNKDYCIRIFNIERTGEKVRKDLVKLEDVEEQLTIFFDELLEKKEVEDISDKVEVKTQREIVRMYLESFNFKDSLDEWFDKVKKIAMDLDISKVGDVAMVLRVALTHRTKSPDLYQTIQVLGDEKIRERLEKYLARMI